MKKFFTVIPEHQNLVPFKKAVGNMDLQMKTKFPILTAVNAYAVPGEDFRLIAIMHDLEIEKCNMEVLHEEFNKLCAEKGLCCTKGVETIIIPADENVSTHIATFQTLLDYVDDDDELYACVTFGTVPLTKAVTLAMQYAYRLKRNASISCVVHGEVVETETDQWYGEVYDMTALSTLDELVYTIARLEVKNPKEIIDRFIKL